MTNMSEKEISAGGPSHAPVAAPDGERVAMFVMNACAPDTRVQKMAVHLARTGRKVRIYCITREGLPDREVVDGVEYRRFALDWKRTILNFLTRR